MWFWSNNAPASGGGITGFIRRHKNKFIFGSLGALVVGGAGVAGYLYYSERQRKWEEQNTLAMRMRYLFEENRKTSCSALYSLLPIVLRILQEEYKAEEILQTFRSLANEEKRVAFETLKIQSMCEQVY
jgi:hypothetical protein